MNGKEKEKSNALEAPMTGLPLSDPVDKVLRNIYVRKALIQFFMNKFAT